MSYQLVDMCFDSPSLSIWEYVGLGAICKHADNKTHDCFPSVETIAASAHASPRQTQRAIQSLIRLGLITRTIESQGRGSKTLYKVHIEPLRALPSKVVNKKPKRKRRLKGDCQSSILPAKKGDCQTEKGDCEVDKGDCQSQKGDCGVSLYKKNLSVIGNESVSESVTLALTSVEVPAEDFQLTEMDSLLSKKKTPDPRNQPFLKALKTYYEQAAKMRPTWDGSDAKHFSDFLAANPQLTLADFQTILTHRAMSDVVHTERPRKWLADATSYLNGPLDRYNKPTNGGNTHVKPERSEKVSSNYQRLNERLNRQDAVAERALGRGGFDEAEPPTG
jgi:Helix-turn-helix domain